MARVIIASVIMASVTYGKCNYGKNIYGKNIMAKILWQMKLSRSYVLNLTKNVKGEIVNRTCHSLNRRLLESSFKEFTF